MDSILSVGLGTGLVVLVDAGTTASRPRHSGTIDDSFH
jgi:hypothetical protein